MPVLAPGERLPASIPFKMPQKLIDKLNKSPMAKKRKRRRRKKPKYKRKKPKHKKKKKSTRKIIGYHKICLKWVVGVIVNRHFDNKKEWKYKDAIFDENGVYRYCKNWGKLPIYEPILKSIQK